jgi:hypothetical protein
MLETSPNIPRTTLQRCQNPPQLPTSPQIKALKALKKNKPPDTPNQFFFFYICHVFVVIKIQWVLILICFNLFRKGVAEKAFPFFLFSTQNKAF